MRAGIISLTLTFLPLANAPCVVPACVCIRTVDPQPAVAASAAVFIARALTVRAVPGYAESAAHMPDSLPLFMDRVTFVVEQGWKGTPPDTVSASIELTGPDCPTRFTPGDRYLVYAEQHDAQYVIGMCTRTARLGDSLAQADLRLLGQPLYQRP